MYGKKYVNLQPQNATKYLPYISVEKAIQNSISFNITEVDI
jgi:hypothetical protein